METEKKTTRGLVEKIEESKVRLKYYEDYKEYELSILFIIPKGWRGIELVEFPRKFSQQEKDMLLGKEVIYTKAITYGYSADYEIEIRDKLCLNWTLKAKFD